MSAASRMPALFIGHGTPMNAIEDNDYARLWRSLGERLPRPKAILAISAHWETRGSAVTSMARPPTIHDFGGFPPELFAMQYPAPGNPALADRVRDLFTPRRVAEDYGWGLDHGTWSVLVHMYPAADIPVVQLSLDMTLSGEGHFELAAKLRPLRDEGVLILGTGNIVHNLRVMDRTESQPPYEWAVRFDEAIKTALRAGNFAPVLSPGVFGSDAQMSIRGPEHYIPLIYAIAQKRDDEALNIFCERIALRSCSMTSVLIGGDSEALLAAA